MELTVNKGLAWLKTINEKIQEKKDYLTDLDQAIGDGDHGINMARGFQEVEKKVEANDYADVSDLLKDAAMTLMSKVGGASGPLFGTAFLKLSMSLKEKDPVDYPSFSTAVGAAAEGIKQRGKAGQGEKTMVDVWVPMAEYLQNAQEFKPDELETKAKSAMEATKEISAKRGRAAYLGDRSIGHLDPGSVSSYYIFAALAETLQERK
ncbi:dihydroxyacetone kinase subunit DhaL [Sediminibacillus albus]|uniref:phosphoenolpyruvate--glycerone phosphotransferase n=1 Tax=Sediminibacillus albus TaxID=407036 RepID=A0A1G8YI11_9BACI|nr:dihydroxyacetone kinase subunit DhaL [Sediminibacillus albus]SDK02074.1 dihydroxyacetone kinase, C-terminal domain [Sediminibacillus albus]